MSRLTETRSLPTIAGENNHFFFIKGGDQSMNCAGGAISCEVGVWSEFASRTPDGPYISTAQSLISPSGRPIREPGLAAPRAQAKSLCGRQPCCGCD